MPIVTKNLNVAWSVAGCYQVRSFNHSAQYDWPIISIVIKKKLKYTTKQNQHTIIIKIAITRMVDVWFA